MLSARFRSGERGFRRSADSFPLVLSHHRHDTNHHGVCFRQIGGNEINAAVPNAAIATAEGADPVAEYKRAYENTKTPEALRALVATLARRDDYHSIGPYAEQLFALTGDPEDIGYAAKRLCKGGRQRKFFASG